MAVEDQIGVLRQSSQKNDASLCAGILGIDKRKQSSNLVHNLFKTPAATRTLVNAAISNLRQEFDFHLARSLLIAPSGYDTPWFFISKLVSSWQQTTSVTMDHVCCMVPEIQNFLQETSTHWRYIENKPSRDQEIKVAPNNREAVSSKTPAFWILCCTNKILACFFTETWFPLQCHIALCELVSGMMQLVQVWNDVVLAQMLDAILPKRNIGPMTVMLRLRLLFSVRPFLRGSDCNKICEMLRVGWNAHDKDFRSNAAMMVEPLLGFDEYFDHHISLQGETEKWKHVVLGFIELSLGDNEIYSVVEVDIEKKVTLLPTRLRARWLDFLSEAESVSPCVRVRMLLLFDETADHSNALWLLNGTQSDMTLHKWGRLSSASRATKIVAKICLRKWTDKSPFYGSIKEYFVETEYLGNGSFKSNGKVSTKMSYVGSLVKQSLGQSKTNTTEVELQRLAHRVSSWITIAELQLESRDTEEAQFASVTIFVSLFLEAPRQRRLIVAALLELISGDRYPFAKRLFAAETLAVIATTSWSEKQEQSLVFLEVYPFLVDRAIPYELYSTIAWSFKTIDLFDEAFSQWVVRGLDFYSFCRRKLDDQKCAIVSCFVLIAPERQSDLSMKALGMLHDIITNENPILPFEMRAWFFHLLSDLLQKNTFCSRSAEKLATACCARFASFCIRSETGWTLDAELAVNVHDNGQTICVHPLEDLGALFQCLTRVVPDKEWNASSVFHGFGTPESPLDEGSLVRPAIRENSLSNTVVFCTALAFQYAAGLGRGMSSSNLLPLFDIENPTGQVQRQFHASITAGMRLKLIDEIIRLLVLSITTQDEIGPSTQCKSLTRLLAVRHDVSTLAGNCEGADVKLWTLVLKYLLRDWQSHAIEDFNHERFHTLASLCEASTAILQADPVSLSIDDITQLLGKLWSCSCSLVRESAARNLVEAIDKTLESDGAQLLHKNGFPRSLPEIYNSNDVDQAVQHVRSAVLGALHKCLELADNESGSVPREKAATLALQLIPLLGSCCDDLYLGMSGKSGGLTKEIFSSLLKLVERCARMVERLIVYVSGDSTRNMVTTCINAEARLQLMLCTYDVDVAKSFKSASRVSLECLPHLQRRLFQEDPMAGRLSYVPDMVLRQCISFIIENESDILAGMKTWEEIFCNVSDSVDGSDPRTTDTSNHIKLADQSSWSSVICSCLYMFGQAWAGYTEGRSFTSEKAALTYFQEILIEGRATLSTVATLFERPKGDRVFIRATLVPESVKVRLCGFLEQVASRLCRSLKLLTQAINGQYQRGNQIGFDLVESVAYALSWLNSDPKLSLLKCTTEWLSAEEEALSATGLVQTGAVYIDSVISRRLPKTLRCVEALEAEVHRACQTQETTQSCCELLQFLEAGRQLLKHNDSTGSVTKWYSNLLEKEWASIQEVRLGANSLSQLEPHRAETGRKNRSSSFYARKAKRRKLLRSRHRTVDNWLHQDREVDETEPVEDDTFSDLEEFLVDG